MDTFLVWLCEEAKPNRKLPKLMWLLILLGNILVLVRQVCQARFYCMGAWWMQEYYRYDRAILPVLIAKRT
jgi:hypothetical protein